MSKEHLSLGEAVRRIAEAERQLKAGNIDKAIEVTPCQGCKEKMLKMKQVLEGLTQTQREFVEKDSSQP